MKPELEFRQVDPDAWRPAASGVAGVFEATLARDEQSGLATILQRYEPGADTTPAGVQAHDFWEEVYILEGSMHDLTLGQTFAAGSYACRPPGMRHGPWRTDAGALVLAVCYAA